MPRNVHVINVRSFGAEGTGFVDDSSAVQLAIDCAMAADGRAILLFPYGTYTFGAAVAIHFEER